MILRIFISVSLIRALSSISVKVWGCTRSWFNGWITLVLTQYYQTHQLIGEKKVTWSYVGLRPLSSNYAMKFAEKIQYVNHLGKHCFRYRRSKCQPVKVGNNCRNRGNLDLGNDVETRDQTSSVDQRTAISKEFYKPILKRFREAEWWVLWGNNEILTILLIYNFLSKNKINVISEQLYHPDKLLTN